MVPDAVSPLVVSPLTLSTPQFTKGMSVEEAAREFEAMLVAQLLKTAREAGRMSEDDNEAAGSESYREFAEKYLTEAIAATDAFGFSRLMVKDLTKTSGISG